MPSSAPLVVVWPPQLLQRRGARRRRGPLPPSTAPMASGTGGRGPAPWGTLPLRTPTSARCALAPCPFLFPSLPSSSRTREHVSGHHLAPRPPLLLRSFSGVPTAHAAVTYHIPSLHSTSFTLSNRSARSIEIGSATATIKNAHLNSLSKLLLLTFMRPQTQVLPRMHRCPRLRRPLMCGIGTGRGACCERRQRSGCLSALGSGGAACRLCRSGGCRPRCPSGEARRSCCIAGRLPGCRVISPER